jgi:hypothetical protein
MLRQILTSYDFIKKKTAEGLPQPPSRSAPGSSSARNPLRYGIDAGAVTVSAVITEVDPSCQVMVLTAQVTFAGQEEAGSR